MKTIDQLKTEQAVELAKLEAKHAIAASLPTGVEAWYIDPKSAYGIPHIGVKVKGLLGALNTLKKFVVVPFAEHRNGCLYLKPLELFAEKTASDLIGNYAFQLNVDQIVGTRHTVHIAANAKMYFYARIAGGLGFVSLDITGPGHIGAYDALGASYRMNGARGMGDSVLRNTIRPNNKLWSIADKTVPWGSGSTNAISYGYLFVADHYDVDQPGDELTNCVDVLANIAVELGEND